MIRTILNKLFWGVYRHMASDEQYARARYRLTTGRKLRLNPPVTLSEKINWLKLNDRSELRRIVADRTGVRQFVADRAGPEHLIPLIGIYDKITHEVWKSLPRQFVLKANHGSGMVKVVRDKNLEDPEKIIRMTQAWRQTDYSEFGREWVYKDLPRTILAEELLLTNEGKVPADYKFFCFEGRTVLFQIDFDRYGDHTRNFYDRALNRVNAKIIYEPNEQKVVFPDNLQEALTLADRLSEGFNFMRVDLYLTRKRVWFGEMTNFPGNGFEAFSPYEFDEKMGRLLDLDTSGQ
ncbi:ATP-grasp fold amidoligase family protein [Rhodohalobacter mucosus]|uniref:Glycosyl transferase n=1 Tax=Rhodohalobacter mucosus TaxID=2079485 RepID=A0A316TNV7_9BACT|nr:ATP-grasp fold amidoligase family protein [Rhodohalobacter mucosus]PWN05341.1 glycosyl transferase [Rhodohalobacter mucosus]